MRNDKMDYPQYIVDWKTNALETEEYANTEKISFSLLNVARDLLNDHIIRFDMTEDQLNHLLNIEKLLEHAYTESSHIEMTFKDKYQNNQ